MRKILILLVLLMAAILITPGVVGFSAETRYRALVDGMAKNGLEVVNTQYQRGWFESTADTEFRIPLAGDGEALPDGAPTEIRFSLHSDIKHGPLSSNGDLVVAQVQSGLQTGGEPLFPDLEGGIFKTDIKLDGSGRLTADLPAMQSEPQPGKPGIQFEGLTGHLTFNAGVTEMSLDLDMPQLAFSGTDGQSFELQNLTLNSHSQQGVADLMFGEGRFAVQHVGFQNPLMGQGVVLDNIDVNFNSDAQGKNVLFSIVYAFKALQVNDAVWGPAVLEIRMENLSADALAKMQRQMEEINEGNLPPTGQGMAVLTVLMETASELLPSDPIVAIPRFRVQTPDGVVEGDMRLQSHGLAWAEIGDAATALGKLEMKASLRMPETLWRTLLEQQARQQIQEMANLRRQLGEEVEPQSEEEIQELARLAAEQKLDSLLTQGLVVRTGSDVATVAGLSNGLLTVNGKTIPLPGQMPEAAPAEEGVMEAPAAEEESGSVAAEEAPAVAASAEEVSPEAAAADTAPVEAPAEAGGDVAAAAGEATAATQEMPADAEATPPEEVTSSDAVSAEPAAGEASDTPAVGEAPAAAETQPEASPPAEAK
jgi:uncharacterized protein YdgA (DUF945 family)